MKGQAVNNLSIPVLFTLYPHFWSVCRFQLLPFPTWGPFGTSVGSGTAVQRDQKGIWKQPFRSLLLIDFLSVPFVLWVLTLFILSLPWSFYTSSLFVCSLQSHPRSRGERRTTDRERGWTERDGMWDETWQRPGPSRQRNRHEDGPNLCFHVSPHGPRSTLISLHSSR